ncbi:hypothetical protein QFZ65_002309 [Arthrobacter sp. B3I9]|uniref:hypothetical protein n=1 Tax=Arthrobacter sp. B3I9 TaxID=3042270 RepID=UPI00278EE27D|nr:hypothetical protein [Arthrobacter sp. B3I9]MDQ0850371.1 hypothetical protein [Arthrobacter sp. B3I9]
MVQRPQGDGVKPDWDGQSDRVPLRTGEGLAPSVGVVVGEGHASDWTSAPVTHDAAVPVGTTAGHVTHDAAAPVGTTAGHVTHDAAAPVGTTAGHVTHDAAAPVGTTAGHVTHDAAAPVGTTAGHVTHDAAAPVGTTAGHVTHDAAAPVGTTAGHVTHDAAAPVGTTAGHVTHDAGTPSLPGGGHVTHDAAVPVGTTAGHVTHDAGTPSLPGGGHVTHDAEVPLCPSVVQVIQGGASVPGTAVGDVQAVLGGVLGSDDVGPLDPLDLLGDVPGPVSVDGPFDPGGGGGVALLGSTDVPGAPGTEGASTESGPLGGPHPARPSWSRRTSPMQAVPRRPVPMRPAPFVNGPPALDPARARMLAHYASSVRAAPGWSRARQGRLSGSLRRAPSQRAGTDELLMSQSGGALPGLG